MATTSVSKSLKETSNHTNNALNYKNEKKIILNTTQHVYYKPSEYIKERTLSTAEKLTLVSTQIDIPEIVELIQDKEGTVKNYSTPMDRPLFQPAPSTIVLQSFEPFVTYEVVINFRNIDKVCFIVFI